MEQYLRQQQIQQQSTTKINSDVSSEVGSSIYGGRGEETNLVEVPDNNALEEFKHQVKMWMEMDNQLKKLSQVLKEKRNVQKLLTEKILAFMQRYNIEDLNTHDGKLRYKVSYSKPVVKKVDIKQKLINYFEHDKDTAQKIVQAVFEDNTQNKVEKVSLRRLKGVRIMNM